MYSITKYPNAALLHKATKVNEDEFGEDLQLFMTMMVEAMNEHGGQGLAANQIRNSKALAIVFLQDGTIDYIVNPTVLDTSEATSSVVEGCLSCPAIKIPVERPLEITLNFQTPLGEYITKTYSGMDSRTVQHELDHLNGKTILHHISKLKRERYTQKARKVRKKQYRVFKKHMDDFMKHEKKQQAEE